MFFAAAIAMGTMKSGPTITVKTSATIPYLRPVALASAPTGSKVLVCNEDGSVRILDAKTHQVVRILAKHIQPAYAAAWSPDGEYVATGDETARIFIENTFRNQLVHKLINRILRLETDKRHNLRITRHALVTAIKADNRVDFIFIFSDHVNKGPS